MVINFVANFQNGYVGEEADQVHLAREMEALGHVVHRIPQDIWKAYCEGERNEEWNDRLPIQADINIITKWHHFVDGSYVVKLREMSHAPVFYWVWDYMNDGGLPQWHYLMAKCADLYLGNDVRDPIYNTIPYKDIKKYYFPFDVCDGNLNTYGTTDKSYDVAFFGSCIGQGHRIEWLKKINEVTPVTCFSWNYEEWTKLGFRAYPAVYGDIFNKVVCHCKIILGFSVEPNCWGYWSNRVGKILTAGAYMLYEYAPGMELMLGDHVDYFSSPNEAIEKIKYMLSHEDERLQKELHAHTLDREFTSEKRVKQLMILVDRFIKTSGIGWKI